MSKTLSNMESSPLEPRSQDRVNAGKCPQVVRPIGEPLLHTSARHRLLVEREDWAANANAQRIFCCVHGPGQVVVRVVRSTIRCVLQCDVVKACDRGDVRVEVPSASEPHCVQCLSRCPNDLLTGWSLPGPQR